MTYREDPQVSESIVPVAAGTPPDWKERDRDETKCRRTVRLLRLDWLGTDGCSFSAASMYDLHGNRRMAPRTEPGVQHGGRGHGAEGTGAEGTAAGPNGYHQACSLMNSACWSLNVLGIGVPFFPHTVPFRTGMSVVVFLGLPSHSLEADFTGLQREKIFPR